MPITTLNRTNGSVRRKRVKEIEERLGRRKLVWFGTRGTDAQALFQISQFAEVYSVVAPLDSLSIPVEVCLESLKGRRVDLDQYNIDLDDSREAQELIRRLFSTLGEPSVIAMYRPGMFFTSIYYPRSEFVEYLGLFQERQAPFEHKPWVESELRRQGVPVIPWRYFGDREKPRLEEIVDQGPTVVRSSRSDGGAGLSLLQSREDLVDRLPVHSDSFVAAAPYFTPSIPLNVNACVFQDGLVSMHSPSLQLIGIKGLTKRTFGYCGNDFAAVEHLEVDALDQLERIVERTGKWLASMGYLGAFGVDALLHHGKVFLTEVNPRFQGSSHLSSQIDVDLDRSDVFLEHIAAFLNLAPGPRIHLRDLARQQRKAAQLIFHNCAGYPVRRNQRVLPEAKGVELVLIPGRDKIVDSEAILCRAVVNNVVTNDGANLTTECQNGVAQIPLQLFHKCDLETR